MRDTAVRRHDPKSAAIHADLFWRPSISTAGRKNFIAAAIRRKPQSCRNRCVCSYLHKTPLAHIWHNSVKFEEAHFKLGHVRPPLRTPMKSGWPQLSTPGPSCLKTACQKEIGNRTIQRGALRGILLGIFFY